MKGSGSNASAAKFIPKASKPRLFWIRRTKKQAVLSLVRSRPSSSSVNTEHGNRLYRLMFYECSCSQYGVGSFFFFSPRIG
jgi:hypothetical protein